MLSRPRTVPAGRRLPKLALGSTRLAPRKTRAAIADADCRATAYRRYLAAVRPRVAAFREEHAADLAEVERQWAELESQAAAARKQWNANYPDVAL